MSANSVGAICIHVTVMVTGDAFIDIYIANDFSVKTFGVRENILILKVKCKGLILVWTKKRSIALKQKFSKQHRSNIKAD